MSHTLMGESQLTLSEAAARLPGKPHVNSLRRWASDGLDGTRLRTWKVGGRRVTSHEALEEFILARSSQPHPKATRMKSASHLAAESKLDEMGIR